MAPRHCVFQFCALTCYTFLVCMYLRFRDRKHASFSQPDPIATQVNTLIEEVLETDQYFRNDSQVVPPIVAGTNNMTSNSINTGEGNNLAGSDLVSYVVQVIEAALILPLSCPTGEENAKIAFVEVLIDGTVRNEHLLPSKGCHPDLCGSKTIIAPLHSNQSSLSHVRSAILSKRKRAVVLVLNVGQCNDTRSVIDFLRHLRLDEVQPAMTLMGQDCTKKDSALLMFVNGHCEIRSPSIRWVLWARDQHLQQLFCGWRTVSTVP